RQVGEARVPPNGRAERGPRPLRREHQQCQRRRHHARRQPRARCRRQHHPQRGLQLPRQLPWLHAALHDAHEDGGHSPLQAGCPHVHRVRCLRLPLQRRQDGRRDSR
ncbi:hypothetical protein BN1723_020431, partial [Verticillium longisporum]